MVDSRIVRTADILVNYSAKVKKGERVVISFDSVAEPLAMECYRLVLKNEAFPIMRASFPEQSYNFYTLATDGMLENFPEIAWYEARNTQAEIIIRATSNTREMSSVDPAKMAKWRRTIHKIHEYTINHHKWILFYYPTAAQAQEADMSLSEFEDFVYRATLIDWKKFSKSMHRLKAVLDKGRKVQILGENTDLRFSIEGRTAIVADGSHNMPDGEVFMAPVETTVNGHIEYSYPAIYSGREVNGVRLEFRKGKCVKATATKNEDFLRKLINTDKGSKYLGEFGIGTNYNINRFTKSILFDEKLGGTVHFALGSAYKEGGGTNKSALHWDMIKDLKKDGQIIVDGKVIQKNGKFLI